MPAIKEANITINGRELSEGQSRAIRTSVLGMVMLMKDPRFRGAMEEMAGRYYNDMLTVMEMIDETEIEQTVEFIMHLAKKGAN